MIPKEQKLVYCQNKPGSIVDSLDAICNKHIDAGWIIHQIIPYGKHHHLLLYKY